MTKSFIQNPISPLTRSKIYEIIFKKSHSSKASKKTKSVPNFPKIFNTDFIEKF
jgi:hypothetical protein